MLMTAVDSGLKVSLELAEKEKASSNSGDEDPERREGAEKQEGAEIREGAEKREGGERPEGTERSKDAHIPDWGACASGDMG